MSVTTLNTPPDWVFRIIGFAILVYGLRMAWLMAASFAAEIPGLLASAGYIPRRIRKDIREKHPGLHLVGFKRGIDVELRELPPGAAVVACPDLGGWLVLYSIRAAEFAQRGAA